MATIEWALLELAMSADPVGRVSALVVVSTVLVAFGLAAVVIASAARTAVRSAATPATVTIPARRFTATPPAPPGAAWRIRLAGLPAPRAPGDVLRRPLREL
jgi:hypothetical protein